MFNLTVDIEKSCFDLYILGVVSCIIFILSLTANSLLIWIIFKNKALRTSINYLITSLAVCNLSGTIIQIPLFSVNAFSCKFIFSHSICILMAFSLYFSANMNDYILVMVCVERYLVICKPSIQSKHLKISRLMLGIFISIIAGSLWSLPPVFGWSEYFYEGVGLSCAINAGSSNANQLSYTLIFLLLGYCTPIIVYLYTSIKIVKTIKESSKKVYYDRQANRKLSKESHLVKITILLICSFFISYTPNVIVIFDGFFKGSDMKNASPMPLTISILIGRSSLIWPSLLYMFMNKDIRKHLPVSI